MLNFNNRYQLLLSDSRCADGIADASFGLTETLLRRRGVARAGLRNDDDIESLTYAGIGGSQYCPSPSVHSAGGDRESDGPGALRDCDY
jgi:hypothetical protein